MLELAINSLNELLSASGEAIQEGQDFMIAKTSNNRKYVVEIPPLFWSKHNKEYHFLAPGDQRAIQYAFYRQVEAFLSGTGGEQCKVLFSTTIEEVTESGIKNVPGIRITPIAENIQDPDRWAKAVINAREVIYQFNNPA